MKKCITCGQDIKDDALFCPYCGTCNTENEQQPIPDNLHAVEDNSDAVQESSDVAENAVNDPFAYNTMNLGQPQAQQAAPQNIYQPQQPSQQVPPMQQTYQQPSQQAAPMQQTYQPQQQVPPMQQAYQPQQQAAPMQQMYQPQYGAPATWQNPDDQPLSVGGWIGTMIVLMIPIVNFIMLLVWAFGSGNKSRKNYCLASLIIAVVMIVLVIIFYVVVGVSAATAFNTMYY